MEVASLIPSPVLPAARLTDSHGRVIHDLRVSITDSCNYKCVYCRTGEVGAQYSELAIDEYLRLIRLFVSLGITKVRLTGGEPLLRRGLVELVRELAGLRTLAGDRLDLEVTVVHHRSNVWKLRGEASVDGTLCAQGELLASVVAHNA